MSVHQRAPRENARHSYYTLLEALPFGLIQPVVAVLELHAEWAPVVVVLFVRAGHE